LTNNLFEKQSEEVLEVLKDDISTLLPGYEIYDLAVAVFLLRVASASEIGLDNLGDIYEKIGNNFKDEIMYYTKVDVVWDKIKSLAKKYDTKVFDYILTNKITEEDHRYRCQGDLPESIYLLIKSILDFRNSNNVLHLYSGTGLLLSKLAGEFRNARFVGFDYNESNYRTSYLRSFNKDNFKCYLGKFVSDINSASFNNNCNKYDIVISNPPFGMKTRMLSDDYRKFEKKRYYMKSGMAAEWFYAGDIMDILNEGGKGITIMSNGCMFTKQDEEARKYFVENGYIEAIIQLPEKLFWYTNVSTVMVIFSRGNKGVRMIKASDYCKKGRRINEFTANDIDNICTMLLDDNENTANVSVEELAQNDYILLPERYTNVSADNIRNGVPLDELVTFKRAATFTANELDAMTESNDNTDFRYLRLSDIQEGCIDVSKLKSIETFDKLNQNLVLKKNDIVLSKNGNSLKVALFDGDDKIKVLPVGNLFVLRVDNNIVRAAYLKVYLESQQGIRQLKNTLTGVAMPVIRLEFLKKLLIPVLPLEEQLLIEKKYYAIVDEIAVLDKQKAQAVDRLSHLLDIVGEG